MLSITPAAPWPHFASRNIISLDSLYTLDVGRWGGPSGRRRDYQSLATKVLANVYQVLAVAIGMRASVMDSACNINLVIASCGGKTDHLSAAETPHALIQESPKL